MVKLLNRMAVKTKLMSSFLLLASFVLILGVTAIIIQQKLEKSQKETLVSKSLSDAFFEGKYFLRSDMHIFTELIKIEQDILQNNAVLAARNRGYFEAKKNKSPFLVTKEQGLFIRKLRWKGMLNKFN